MHPRRNWPLWFLWMAFNCFGVFGLEFVVISFGIAANGQPDQWTALQNVTHHLVTVAIWVALTLLLLSVTRLVTGWHPFARTPAPNRSGWLIAIGAVVAYIAITSILWGGFKPWIEWNDLGPVVFASQYVYYLAEAWVVWCTIAFAQEAFDRWWPKLANVPWGGIFLALTWGLMHIVSKDAMTGVMVTVTAILLGVIHNAARHDVRRSFPLIALAFLV